MPAINLKDRFNNGTLDLSSCGLKEIPQDIANLKNLTSLNLSNNKLNSLGKIIGHLTSLSKLDLSRNSIKGIPENFGNLTNLKHLNLSNNSIVVLPSTLGNLKKLNYIDLKNNKLSPKFSEVVGSCQNESQCQAAAKNIVKLFSKSEKNNSADVEPKKKNKNEKKTVQNGKVANSKQRNKKAPKGFFGKLFHAIFKILNWVITIILLSALVVYGISIYNPKMYGTIKSYTLPHYKKAVGNVLSPDRAKQLDVVLLTIGEKAHNVITRAVTSSKQFYKYVTTDEKIQKYVQDGKKVVLDTYNRVFEAVYSFVKSYTTPKTTS